MEVFAEQTAGVLCVCATSVQHNESRVPSMSEGQLVRNIWLRPVQHAKGSW